MIDAANSQPYSHIHRPGVAVGGHCIPVYPRFYLAGDARRAAARRRARGQRGDAGLRRRAARRTCSAASTATRVLILGVAYRGGVKETAFSGAFPLRDALLGRGAQVVAADPLYDDAELRALGFEPWDGEPVEGVDRPGRPREYADARDPGRRRSSTAAAIVRDAGGVPLRRIGS